MATTMIEDRAGRVVYVLSGHLEYEAKADLAQPTVMNMGEMTDMDPRPNGPVPLGLTTTVPTIWRATLDSLARALDNGRPVKVTVEWE
jgi:hypothetical protein